MFTMLHFPFKKLKTLGIEGFTTSEDQESISRIEKQLKKRFAVGTHVSEHLIVQDFVQRQHYRESLVKKAIFVTIHLTGIFEFLGYHCAHQSW